MPLYCSLMTNDSGSSMQKVQIGIIGIEKTILKLSKYNSGM
jgi:hypothetical protein